MNILDKIKEVISLEVATLQDLLNTVDESFVQAVELIYEHSDKKIIFSGMGKSGHIATKIVATFSSTGTPAIFLHPAEALHGDLGIVEEGDILVLISKSGESDEMIGMLPSLKKIGCKIISITANLESSLAKNSDIALYTPIEKEACSLNLAPTCSVVAALAVGDALAVALMNLKNFQRENFALYHPAGRLGKRLLYLVDDLMRGEDKNPVVLESDSFEAVLTALSNGGTAAVSVSDADGKFLGLITSYDIRNALAKKVDLYQIKAGEIMFKEPITISLGSYAVDAYEIMKNNPKPLNVLPVLDQKKCVVGMITLQDMVREGL
ncbi:MAG: arabinose-5-phosphate isomerase [bacterium]|jgi:arabinose-5-phosphate isomerase